MKKQFKKTILSLILTVLATCSAFSQQVYISNITVKYTDGADNNSKYCLGSGGTARDYYVLSADGNPWGGSSLIEFDQAKSSYPGGCLQLCATIKCEVGTSGGFAVNSLNFEIFKFTSGTNPLDPGSAPPLRTMPLYSLGRCDVDDRTLGPFCSAWDGSYNVDGEFGKTNGQYGFRAIVETNDVSATAGNIVIKQTSGFPGQNQIPIQIDVTNIHAVRSSPTVVGQITGIAAQPYNLQYRLSKDAETTITIYEANQLTPTPNENLHVRTLVDHLPRVGEGTPSGSLTNGDFWDGRDNNGQLVPSGVYFFKIDAQAYDEFPGLDVAWATTRQISIDPLQITDIRIKALGPNATDLATVGYMLTEAATVYVNIYPPGTYFTNVNTAPPAASAAPVHTIIEQKEARKAVLSYWDGRNSSGAPVPDGDYVYAVYAELPSYYCPGGGVVPASCLGAITIRTKKTLTGTIPVSRGFVGVSQIQPSSTVIGSSPAVGGLDPFYFRYSLSRDAAVTVKIYDSTGSNLIKTLVDNEVRISGVVNKEPWNGMNESGYYVSNGVYLIELVAADPFFPSKTTRVTSLFPVDLFRITDVKTTTLMGGASEYASITYQLSQTMHVAINIYPPGTIVSNPTVNWPPVLAPANAAPVFSMQGVRPGRYKITEFWDGRDSAGQNLADGVYVFTLVAKSTGATGQIIYPTDKVYGTISVARGQIIFSLFEIIPSVPMMYNSSETVKLPPYEIAYTVTRQSSMTIQVLNTDVPPKVIANVVSGEVRDEDIIYRDFWDGKDDGKNFVNTGAYFVRAIATDLVPGIGTPTTVQQTLDVSPLQIYDVAITPLLRPDQPNAFISYQVSEPMKVGIKIYKPGTSFDQNGNVSPPEGVSLLKRIVGVRAARILIDEPWDGTDMRMSAVADGADYKFKIYASTDADLMDSITGNYSPGAIIDDMEMDNIAVGAVSQSGPADVCGDFESGAFVYPNPLRTDQGKFHVRYPVHSNVTLKIYNLAGERIFEYDFGERGSAQTAEYTWQKKNTYGKTVTHGVFFAVFRMEATGGSKEVCQTVKKILIP